MARDPVAVATSLLRALEAGRHGEDLRKYFAASVLTPNQCDVTKTGVRYAGNVGGLTCGWRP
jgi:hypothetical protein